MGVNKFDEGVEIFYSSDEIALFYQPAGKGYILRGLQFVTSKHDYFDAALSQRINCFRDKILQPVFNASSSHQNLIALDLILGQGVNIDRKGECFI